MSKTALIDALEKFDVEKVRTILKAAPELKQLHLGNGLNLLQFSCKRSTASDPAAADRQLRLAKWLMREGFDPLAMHTTAAGEDGEEEPANVSLVWFAVAKAQNNRLARYFLAQGAPPGALFAAAWWGKGYDLEVVKLLLQHGADPDLPGKDGRTVRQIASRKKDKRYFEAIGRPHVFSEIDH